MAFAPDHNDVDRVFDAERKIALSRWVRDAPVDERWFRLEFDDVGVVLKARWSMQETGTVASTLSTAGVWKRRWRSPGVARI